VLIPQIKKIGGFFLEPPTFVIAKLQKEERVRLGRKLFFFSCTFDQADPVRVPSFKFANNRRVEFFAMPV